MRPTYPADYETCYHVFGSLFSRNEAAAATINAGGSDDDDDDDDDDVVG